MAKNLHWAWICSWFYDSMLMHFTTTGKKVWCHSKWYYTGLWPGTGLEQYPVTGSKTLNWFYICWRQQNTLVRGSRCATSIPPSGARDGREKGLQHAVTASKRRVPLCNDFSPGWQEVARRKWWLWNSLALLTCSIARALESSSFREDGRGKLCSTSAKGLWFPEKTQEKN